MSDDLRFVLMSPEVATGRRGEPARVALVVSVARYREDGLRRTCYYPQPTEASRQRLERIIEAAPVGEVWSFLTGHSAPQLFLRARRQPTGAVLVLPAGETVSC